MTYPRVGVLISGRGSNLESLLRAAEQGDLLAEIAVVGTNRASAAGLEHARRASVPVVIADRAEFPRRAERQQRLLQLLEPYALDLLVLAGFDEILGSAILKRYHGRILNIHPSLLPSFGGGMHAVREALEHGVKVSGCTVHFVTPEVDQGPIVLQAAVPVEEDDDEASLAARILAEEHRILPRAVRLFAEGRLRLEGRRVRILPASSALPSSAR